MPGITFVRAFRPGANGVVFEAMDVMLERPLAVKVWDAPRGEEKRKRRQATKEARKIARLAHPQIVTVYQSGTTGHDWVYCTMELLHGSTLQDHLQHEQPDISSRLALWDDIIMALHYAHSQQLYHGDLHDCNVMVSNGHATVIDFGTSLFARSRAASRRRASRMLSELASTLLFEDKNGMRALVTLDTRRLHPNYAFCSAVGCSELLIRILLLKHKMMRMMDSDYDSRHTTFGLSILLSAIPLLDPEAVVRWLESIDVAKRYVQHFLDALYAEYISKLEGTAEILIVPRDTPVQGKLVRLRPARDDVLDKFMDAGPAHALRTAKEFVPREQRRLGIEPVVADAALRWLH